MERLTSFFGSKDKPQEYGSVNQNDEESSGLIQNATESVFGKTQEMTETLDSYGSDLRIAGFFLVISVMFGMMSLSALPFILFSPMSFFKYFIYCFIFFQCALAFYWGPGTYLKKACSCAGEQT